MQPSTVSCDHCTAANRATARFCTSCGHPLSVASPPPHPPQAPPVPPRYWENLQAELASRPRPPKVPKRSVVCTYRGHRLEVAALAWSPDGTRLASASHDSTVHVWEATTGTLLLTYRGHPAPVRTVAWSPDGRRIASGGDDQTVQVWQATDASHIFTSRGHARGVYALAWSPDGTRLASGSEDTTVQVWEAADGSHVFTYHDHFWVYAVSWSPDGTRLASAGGNGVKVWDAVKPWDATDGGHVYSYHGGGYYDRVYTVAWSPDGTRLVAGNRGDNMVVWDAVSRKTLLTCTAYGGQVESVAWSPDGRRIASDSRNDVLVWDASSGAALWIYCSVQRDRVLFSSFWKRLSQAFFPIPKRTRSRWIEPYQGHGNAVKAVAWSPDSTRIASASTDTTVQVWQVP